MTKLYLVRHAETRWNKVGFLGVTDIDLSENGKNQAQEFAHRLKNSKIDIIYSSMLKRSIHTAEEIAKIKKLEVIQRPELNEVHFGIFEALTLDAAREKYPDIFNDRLKDKSNYRIPGGESYEDAYRRVEPFIKEIFSIKGGYIFVAITHATILKILYSKLSKKPLAEVERYYWGNCSYFVIEDKRDDFEIVQTSFQADKAN